MGLNDFLAKFAEQFEDTDVTLIKPETQYHDLDEWSSLIGMSVIAMVKLEYGKKLTGEELRHCKTVNDLFNLIASK